MLTVLGKNVTLLQYGCDPYTVPKASVFLETLLCIRI